MIIEGNVLTADSGKLLTNGKVFSEKVYLGIYDSPDNWHEVDEADAITEGQPTDDEADLAEAARILLGVSE